MIRHARTTALLAIATLVAAAASPRTRAADAPLTDPIILGEYGSLTGGTATFGISTDEGIQLGVDQINAGGGVLGRPVKVIVEDDQGRPQEAVTVVQKLITQDKVAAVLGEVTSSNSLAAAPVCERAHVPMMSPSSTNPKVTKVGSYIFRACFIDPFQGAAMANYATGTLGMKRIAVLYDVAQDYSKGLHDFFIEAVKKGGGEIVADESYATNDIDFKAQLTKILAKHPDGLYVPGYYSEAGLICLQARQLGLTVPLMGGDGWDSDKTYAIGGAAVNGCYFTNHCSLDDPRPAVQAFVAAYKAKFNGKTPDSMAVLGYDAVRLVADAMQRAGGTKGKAVRDALAATRDFAGVGGSITIDKDRNAEKPIVILKVDDDKPRLVASVQP